MRVTELEPQFVKIIDERTTQDVDDIASADGIMFVCPKCIITLGGRAGAHSVLCWQPHVPQSRTPGPGRWNFIGTGYSDLTLLAGSSSIALTGDGCKAHFWITSGEIVNA